MGILPKGLAKQYEVSRQSKLHFIIVLQPFESCQIVKLQIVTVSACDDVCTTDRCQTIKVFKV